MGGRSTHLAICRPCVEDDGLTGQHSESWLGCERFGRRPFKVGDKPTGRYIEPWNCRDHFDQCVDLLG